MVYAPGNPGEPETEPGDRLRTLCFGAHVWLTSNEEFRNSYRSSEDTKFLVASANETEPAIDPLSSIAFRGEQFDAEKHSALLAVDVTKDDFADWCERNQLQLPRFWFPAPADFCRRAVNMGREIPANWNPALLAHNGLRESDAASREVGEVSGRPFDWAVVERPYYPISRIVRYWCEIPNEKNLVLDRRTLLPLPDPDYPLVEVRTLLLCDAIETYQLPHEVAPDKEIKYCRGEGIQWRHRIVRRDALIVWFKRYRHERPPFLFWQDVGAENPDAVAKECTENALRREEPEITTPAKRKATPTESTLYRIIGALAQALAEAQDSPRVPLLADGKAFAGGGVKGTGVAGYLLEQGLTSLKPTALQDHIGTALKNYERPKPRLARIDPEKGG